MTLRSLDHRVTKYLVSSGFEQKLDGTRAEPVVRNPVRSTIEFRLRNVFSSICEKKKRSARTDLKNIRSFVHQLLLWVTPVSAVHYRSCSQQLLAWLRLSLPRRWNSLSRKKQSPKDKFRFLGASCRLLETPIDDTKTFLLSRVLDLSNNVWMDVLRCSDR